MSETWKETVNVDYTYDCPTHNYLDGWDKVESITENYNGPARLVALIDKETSLVEVVLREWEAYDGRPNRLNCDTVVVDCSKDALLCEVLSDYHNNHLDAEDAVDTREIRSIATPEGFNEFTWPYPHHPDALYDDRKTTYDKSTKEFVLVKNTNEDIIGAGDWDTVRSLRNEILQNTDGLLATDAPASVTSSATEYRQKLRDLPESLSDVDVIFVQSSFPTNDLGI
jgi:hypothetical protein